MIVRVPRKYDGVVKKFDSPEEKTKHMAIVSRNISRRRERAALRFSYDGEKLSDAEADELVEKMLNGPSLEDVAIPGSVLR